MGRIICIDYGGKRTGLAVTDPLKIIATGLTAVDTKDLMTFLKKYFVAENVELILMIAPFSVGIAGLKFKQNLRNQNTKF